MKISPNVSTTGVLFLDPGSGATLKYAEVAHRIAHSVHSPELRLQPRNTAAAIESLVTACALGRHLTLYDPDLTGPELKALTNDIADAPTTPAVEPAHDRPHNRVGEDVSEEFRLTLFTSGTTGIPKKVTHSLSSLARTLRVSRSHRSDIWGLAYNPTHMAGVQVILQAFFNGNTLVNLFDSQGAEARARIEAASITHLSATPSFYRLLLSSDEPFRSVRSVTLGGERSDNDLITRLRAVFPFARLRNLYASTEAGTILTAESDEFTIPIQLEGRVRVHDDQLEIHHSLLGDCEKPGSGQAGWYLTGDVVAVVSNDPLRFRIVGRLGDSINVGGNKVNPADVERELLVFPGVREARVFGRPNSVLGNLLCAEVVASSSVQEPELREFLSARMQGFKIPRFIRFVEGLERTRTGKVKRT